MVQATIAYFTSPSNRVLPTPVVKPKAAPVSPLPLKVTEPQFPELINPKDGMKVPIKRTISINSLSEQGTNGTTTSMISPTSEKNPPPPPQANGQPIQKSGGSLVPPQDPPPKKKVRRPPRPDPAASLFIPSKKVRLTSSRLRRTLTTLHSGHYQTQTWRGRARDDTRLQVYHGLPCSLASQLISTHTTR